MANRKFDKPYCIGERQVIISGSFVALTGAGTVDATKVTGFGFGYAPVAGKMALQTSARPGIAGTVGIVRTGTGVYMLTLDDAYLECTAFNADVAGPVTGTNLFTQLLDPPATSLGTAGTAPVFTLVLVSGSGTPTDASAGMRVHFQIVLRDSTERFNKP